jgi:hypothetical protein
MRVVETRGEPDLPDEPLGAEHLRQLGMEDLQSDWTVVAEIADEIDCGHPAAPELAVEAVAVAKGDMEPREEVRHVLR